MRGHQSPLTTSNKAKNCFNPPRKIVGRTYVEKLTEALLQGMSVWDRMQGTNGGCTRLIRASDTS